MLQKVNIRIEGDHMCKWWTHFKGIYTIYNVSENVLIYDSIKNYILPTFYNDSVCVIKWNVSLYNIYLYQIFDNVLNYK